MNKAQVSVIIPCYNREKYIEKCITSIQEQTLSELEIIFVNDGSTDNSLEIVKRLAEKDPRINIYSQSQSGVATARNTGLRNATAPYIMWCDSDDYFDKTMCEKMFNTIKEKEVDIVTCAMKLTYTDSSDQKDIADYVRLKFDGKQNLDFHHILLTDVSLPTKIFKKSLIDKYNMDFPDGLHFEDAYFCDQYFSMAKTIFYLQEELYHYVRHSESIMSKSFKKTPISLDYIKIIPKTMAFLKKYDSFDKNADFFWHRFIQYYSFTYNNTTRKNRKNVQNWGRDFIKTYEKDLSLASDNIQHDLKKLINNQKSIKQTLYKNKVIRKIWESILKPIFRR